WNFIDCTLEVPLDIKKIILKYLSVVEVNQFIGENYWKKSPTKELCDELGLGKLPKVKYTTALVLDSYTRHAVRTLKVPLDIKKFILQYLSSTIEVDQLIYEDFEQYSPRLTQGISEKLQSYKNRRVNVLVDLTKTYSDHMQCAIFTTCEYDKLDDSINPNWVELAGVQEGNFKTKSELVSISSIFKADGTTCTFTLKSHCKAKLITMVVDPIHGHITFYWNGMKISVVKDFKTLKAVVDVLVGDHSPCIGSSKV
ncbi:MAG: hypothetical protein AAF335_00440, partial [Bacteroidota bacterium]